MPVKYDDRDPDDEPDPLGRLRQGRDCENWPRVYALSQRRRGSEQGK